MKKLLMLSALASFASMPTFAAQLSMQDEVKAVFAKQSEAFARPPRFTIAHQLLRHWIEN